MPESRREIEELLAEAKYYLVQGLLEECQAALQVGTSFCPTRGTKPTCHLPFPVQNGPCPVESLGDHPVVRMSWYHPPGLLLSAPHKLPGALLSSSVSGRVM